MLNDESFATDLSFNPLLPSDIRGENVRYQSVADVYAVETHRL